MDWLTGIVTVAAMELVARRLWQGWLLGLLNQALWLYVICERQVWGLLPLTAVLSWRYAMALVRWRREDALA